MSEHTAEISKPLVIGHKRDGRCCYDRKAKRELVEACLKPGVSVARMALQHGVNANLVRTWITRYHRERGIGAADSKPSAFVPVVRSTAYPKGLKLEAWLPNGVKVALGEMGAADLPSLLRLLGELPCSGSMGD